MHALPHATCTRDRDAAMCAAPFPGTSRMTPRRLFATCALLVALPFTHAHATPAQVQALQQVNRDIWEPFVRGVGDFDEAAWSGVRSRDFVMVQRGKPQFLDHDFYIEDSAKVMRELKQAGTRLALEVRFEERMTDGEYSSERGLVRTTMTEAGKPARTFHSRFHAISRLEHGHWRVLTEYRTPAGPDAEQAWSAAFPMASVAATLKE